MRLYGKFVSINIRCQMQYKTSFFLTCLGQFFVAFNGFIGIWFMFDRFNTVAGFTLQEVLLCFSAINMAFSLSECFVRGFDAFSGMISNGEFDRILLRPRNTIFLVLASKMDFSRLGKLLQGVIVMAFAMCFGGIIWTWDKLLCYLIMIVTAALLFAGLFLIFAGLCFFTTEGLEFINIFTDGGREFGQYPISVYGKGVLRFLTFAVPLALVQYYPFLYLIGREESVFYMLIPFASLLFLIPCYIIWRIGLRHYRSTGS